MDVGVSSADRAISAEAASSGPEGVACALQPQAAAPARRYARWWLAGPLLLLGVEIAVLTPQVEFRSGPMVWLASPRVGTALIFAAVLVWALCGKTLAGILSVGRPAARLSWLVVHLCCFVAFFYLSKAQAGGGLMDAQQRWLSGAWLLLAVAVGTTALLAWFSFNALRRMASAAWRQAVGALLMGSLLAIATPYVQNLWHSVDRPAVGIARGVLDWCHPHRSLAGYSSTGNPVLGLRLPMSWMVSSRKGEKAWDAYQIELEVTPHCAEMESIAAFVLLGVALLVANWRAASLWRWLLVMLAGVGLLYLFNAVRLALLVEIGAWTTPMRAVHIAHSRLSGMALLAVSVAVMLLTRRLWCRRETTAGQTA